MDKSKEKDKEITELRQAGEVYITNACSYAIKLENFWCKDLCSFSFDGGTVKHSVRILSVYATVYNFTERSVILLPVSDALDANQCLQGKISQLVSVTRLIAR